MNTEFSQTVAADAIRTQGIRLGRRLARGAIIGFFFGAGVWTRAAESPAEAAAWAAFSRSSPAPVIEHYASPADEFHELEIYASPATTEKNARPKRVLLLVHGGGWGGGARDVLAPHARYFAARGWVAVNISYRLTNQPNVTLMNAQEDVRAAFDWVRTQASSRGWDANHIVVLGESAGGQLACALGILPPDPSRWRAHSLVLVNPVLDLTTLSWALTQPGLREGGPFDPASAAQHPAYRVSPLFHLAADSPPILLIHGRSDTVVPFSQVEAFIARGKQVGAKVELVALENTGHAFLLQQFGQPEAIRSTLQRIAKFLDER
jgi:acetyl esterase